MSVFPKYERYKDSGVEWLGEVPEHWELSRSRRIFVQRKELARADDPQLSATQAYGVIPQADYEERIGRKVVKISMHLEKRKHVEPDDFVISMRSFQGGLERAWARGCIRSSYTILQPSLKVAPSYFAYLFKSPQYIAALQTTGSFIRDGQDLTYENFILVDLPVPPFEEQARIGAFLDRKTVEIDDLIAKKQRQIELLGEQKAILINRAVTRGLNPNAKFKSSGIEEIGAIPESWSVKRVRNAFRVIDCKHLTVPFNDGGYALVSIGELNGLEVDTSNAKQTDEKHFKHLSDGERALRAGDLIFSRNASVGKCSIVVEPSNCSMGQDVCLLRSQVVAPGWAIRFLRSPAFKKQIAHLLLGSTFNRINISELKELSIAVPPSDDVPAILARIEALDQEYAAAVSLCEREIEVLQGLRVNLIAHAVTGRVKI